MSACELETMQILDCPKGVLVLTCIDYSKNEISAKWFETRKEALTWAHDLSLSQMPKWHEKACLVCQLREET